MSAFRMGTLACNLALHVLLLGVISTVTIGDAQAQTGSFPILMNTPSGEFGDGYDGLNGNIAKKCVHDSAGPSDSPLRADTFDLVRVKSRSDYRSTMEFDAAASFGYGMFSGKASVSSYSEDRESNFSHLLLLRSVVEIKQSVLSRPEFDLEALDALKQSPQAFYERCGTSYIKGYIYGGSFFGTYQLTTKEKFQERDVAAAIDVSLGAYGSGSASLKETTTTLSTTENLSYKTVQFSGADSPENTDPATIETYAHRFKIQAAANPFPTHALIDSYAGLSLKGCGLLQARCRRNLHSFTSQLRTLNELVKLREKGLNMRDELLEAQDYPANFWGTDANEIKQALKETEATLSTVGSAADTCRNIPLRPCMVPDTRYPNVQLRRAIWKDVEITKDDGGPIGQVQPGEKKVVVVRGTGWKGAASLTTCNHSNTLIFTVTNTLKGKIGEYIVPVPVLVGPPAGQGILIVSARAGGDIPGQYFDNVQCNPNDPLQAALVDASAQDRAVLRTAEETNLRLPQTSTPQSGMRAGPHTP